MKIIITVISALVLMASCKRHCEDEAGNLTTEELSWLSYSGGETLIFKSNNNVIDTFYVGSKTTNNTSVSHGGSSNDCRPMQQTISCIINEHPFYLGIFGLHSDHKNEWSPNGSAYIATTDNIFTFHDYAPQNNIMINGIKFNDVYIMHIDTTISKGIWQMFYTKQHGILRYDKTNGERWEKIN